MIPLQCTQGSRWWGWNVDTGGSGLCLLAGFTISTVKPSRPDITVQFTYNNNIMCTQLTHSTFWMWQYLSNWSVNIRSQWKTQNNAHDHTTQYDNNNSQYLLYLQHTLSVNNTLLNEWVDTADWTSLTADQNSTTSLAPYPHCYMKYLIYSVQKETCELLKSVPVTYQKVVTPKGLLS